MLKVTARLEYDRSRPVSPLKAYTPSASPTPAIRPRAKINSSANIATRKPVSSPAANNLTPTSRTNVSNTRVQGPRAPSPAKSTQIRATVSASTVSQVKARVGGAARANATLNSAGLPELRQRALTTTPADLPANRRVRRGSISSHVSASPILAPIRTAQSPPQLGVAASEDGMSVVSGSSVGQVRVKSKVTRLAEHTPYFPQSLPSSPSVSAHPRPGRVPSVSNLSLSPPLAQAQAARSGSPVVPTIGLPRHPPSREVHVAKIPPFRPFIPHDDVIVHYSGHVAPTKADPAHIPLPPQSPPTSTLSFSSRSSASCDTRSSEQTSSTAPTVHSRVNGVVRHARSRSSVDGLGIQLSPLSASREPLEDVASPVYGSDDDYETHADDPERKKQKEAKSNRKVSVALRDMMPQLAKSRHVDCRLGDNQQIAVGH